MTVRLGVANVDCPPGVSNTGEMPANLPPELSGEIGKASSANGATRADATKDMGAPCDKNVCFGKVESIQSIRSKYHNAKDNGTATNSEFQAVIDALWNSTLSLSGGKKTASKKSELSARSAKREIYNELSVLQDKAEVDVAFAGLEFNLGFFGAGKAAGAFQDIAGNHPDPYIRKQAKAYLAKSKSTPLVLSVMLCILAIAVSSQIFYTEK